MVPIELSVVIPIRNEAPALAELVSELTGTLTATPLPLGGGSSDSAGTQCTFTSTP